MSEKKSFLDRVAELFQSRSPRGKGQSPHSRKRSLQVEQLEVRELLSAVGFTDVQDAIEGLQSGFVRVERTDTQGQLVVNYRIESGNMNVPNMATNGEDYNHLPGTLNNGNNGSISFAHGQKFVDIPVVPIDDTIAEGTERVRLALVSGNDYTIDPLHATATLRIQDNDIAPNVWIDSVQNATEPNGTGKFILKRDDTAHSLTVNFTFDNSYSSASFGNDFTIDGMPYYYSTASVTFAKGSDTAEILVKTKDDMTVENAESVVIRLAEPTTTGGIARYTLDQTRRSATLSIIDNDIAPSVWIDSVVNASEPSANGKFIVKRGDTTNALSIGYTFDYSNSTASFGNDFTIDGFANQYTTGTLTFAAGADTAEIVIKVKDDSTVENAKSVRINLGNPAVAEGREQYTLDQTRRYGALIINDNDVAPNVWIDSITHASEPGGTGKFILKRSNPTNALAVNFTFDQSYSSASFGNDFTIDGMPYYYSTGTVTFAAGSDTAEIVIKVKDDTTVENPENVVLRLSDPSNVGGVLQYALDQSRRSGSLVITDNDVAPNVWIDSVVNSAEPVTNGKFIVKRSDTTNALAVNFTFDQSYSSASFGNDFTIDGMPYYYSTGTVTFAAGSDTAEIIVRVKDDTTVENAKSVRIKLGDPNVAEGRQQYTLDQTRRFSTLVISNNDVAPNVWIDSITHASEPGGTGKFILKRSDPTNALAVNFTFDQSYSSASFGNDFTIDGMPYYYSTGTVTFAAGSDTAEIIVRVKDDATVENPENVVLRLADPSNVGGALQYTLDQARRSGSLVVTDNDVAPNVWIDSVVHGKERSNDGKIILKRNDTANALTINFTFDSSRSTASFGTDFTIDGMPYYYSPGTVTFLAGSDTAEIAVNVKDDATNEPDETIFIRLNDPGNVNGILQYALDETRRDAVVLVTGETPPVPSGPKVWIDSVVGAAEPSTDGKFILKRDDATSALSVNYTFDYSYSTASYGNDFTIDGLPNYYASGTVMFAAGALTAEINVRVKDDAVVENAKSVRIRLGNPSASYYPTRP